VVQQKCLNLLRVHCHFPQMNQLEQLRDPLAAEMMKMMMMMMMMTTTMTNCSSQ
jgi:hypothetical protein